MKSKKNNKIVLLQLGILMMLFCLNAKSSNPTNPTKEPHYDAEYAKLLKIKNISKKAEAHYELANWTKKNISPNRQQCEYMKILTYAPDFKPAREKLGFIKYKNKWIYLKSLKLWEKGSVKRKLRVLTFNILRDRFSQPLWQWNDRYPMIADIIKMTNPDIIGTQESSKPIQFDSLKPLLPEYEFIKMPIPSNIHNRWIYGGDLLYKKDKFKFIKSGYIPFHPEGKYVGWSKKSVSRGSIWVKLKDKVSGEVFCIYSAHVDWKTKEANEGGGQLLLNHAKKVNKNVKNILMMGDWNSGRSGRHSKLYGMMTKNKLGLKDSKRNALQNGQCKPRAKDDIDWILYKSHMNMPVLFYDVIDYRKGKVRASDHIAVLAVFGLPK